MINQWWAGVWETPYHYALSMRAAGRVIAVLFILAGIVTSATPMLPRPPDSDSQAITIIGVTAVLCGIVCWITRWDRLPRWLLAAIPVPAALLLIATHNYFAHDPYRYGVYFIVCFMGIGITNRQGVAIMVSPLALAAYLVPMYALHLNHVALASAAYMLPMLVVIGESLAWISHRGAMTQARLEYLAYHDSLTGLYNRAYFYKELDDIEKNISIPKGISMVMLVDLNDFKSVNDTFGHGTGDILLRETAERLEASTLGHGIWARLGGDEFGCIVPQLGGVDSAFGFVQLVRSALEQSLTASEIPFKVGISIGFALMPQHGATAKAALAHADRAVYADKVAPQSILTRPIALSR